MIINIRGTSGSGKSTVMRRVMKQLGEPQLIKLKGKIMDYKIPTQWGDVYILGRYETPCGGCDGIPTQDEVRRRVRKYSKKGHVLFEGLIVTSCYGKYRDLFRKSKQPYSFLFLKTNIETCIKRVEARRAKRGTTKPLNPANTIAKYKCNMRVIERCEEDGEPFLHVGGNKAVEEILRSIKENSWRS